MGPRVLGPPRDFAARGVDVWLHIVGYVFGCEVVLWRVSSRCWEQGCLWPSIIGLSLRVRKIPLNTSQVPVKTARYEAVIHICIYMQKGRSISTNSYKHNESMKPQKPTVSAPLQDKIK